MQWFLATSADLTALMTEGFDSAEIRKERSVPRHAALCMALVTWIEVWERQHRSAARARTFPGPHPLLGSPRNPLPLRG